MSVATALDALNIARMAWERSQPQYVLDLYPDARALGEVAPAPSPEPPHGATSPSARALAAGGRIGHERPSRRASPNPPAASARAFAPGAEPGRASPPRDGQPPVRDTAAPTGASAPSTPAEEAAVHAAPTTEASLAIRESSASAGLPLAPNGPGRKSPKTQRGQGRKGA